MKQRTEPKASDEVLRGAPQMLNRFRAELGTASRSARPAPNPDLLAAHFELLMGARVPVFSVGLGNPGRERVARYRERGIRVIAMAATVADARALAEAGVDVIAAQGSEAGGHRSTFVKTESPRPPPSAA